MTARLHLPHPHITASFIEHFGEGFFAALLHHQPQPLRAVPPATDWDDWHYAPAQADWENER